MNQQTSQILGGNATDKPAVRNLYQQLMDGWNQGSGDAFAAWFWKTPIWKRHHAYRI
jgi:hypothetical protein